MNKERVMKNLTILNECLTYDDILLRPRYSEILPHETILDTHFSRRIELKIPIVSSAMDTVTESQTAIAMALCGGIGVIHKNLSPELQSMEVKKVKDYKVSPQQLEQAAVDPNQKLRVAAAMGVSDAELKRADLLVASGVDALVIDTAHGHSLGVMNAIAKLKKRFPDQVDVVAGNVATPEACLDLIKSGVDGIKVGIGPGSICTTRIVAGIGVPQVTAINECYDICRTVDMPYIADGGLKFSGDIVKALGLGAYTVMIGSLFAGCDESPGEEVVVNNRKYKKYRGMGSLGAMQKGSKDRYGQGGVMDVSKLVPEGVEGMVAYRGKLQDIVFQLVGGIRSGMGYVGAKTIPDLKRKAEFIRISKASYKESHVHDIIITEQAPNYCV